MKAQPQKDFSSFFDTMLKMRKIIHQTLDDDTEDNIPTMLQVQTLKIVKENPLITASELASKLQMSSSALTQMTDRLIKSRFISRKTDSKDRRLILLTLTNNGEKHLASILQRMQKKANQILAPISAQDLQTVVNIFENFLKKYEK